MALDKVESLKKSGEFGDLELGKGFKFSSRFLFLLYPPDWSNSFSKQFFFALLSKYLIGKCLNTVYSLDAEVASSTGLGVMSVNDRRIDFKNPKELHLTDNTTTFTVRQVLHLRGLIQKLTAVDSSYLEIRYLAGIQNKPELDTLQLILKYGLNQQTIATFPKLLLELPELEPALRIFSRLPKTSDQKPSPFTDVFLHESDQLGEILKLTDVLISPSQQSPQDEPLQNELAPRSDLQLGEILKLTGRLGLSDSSPS
jgi:hypothetical protein